MSGGRIPRGPKYLTLKCDECGEEFQRLRNEVEARLRVKPDTKFFCCSKCAGINSNRSRKKPPEVKICPTCGKQFETKIGSTFCNPTCASRGSVTEARRAAGRRMMEEHLKKYQWTPERVQETLKRREAWKYTQVESLLTLAGVNFEFEYLIEDRIYDLALLDKKILIEFDGDEHKYNVADDLAKASLAESKGWRVVHIPVTANQIIDPECVKAFVA